ncbi:MAG TPA: isochorismatase family protein [Rhabdochlamydiaceae bacterium]
MASLTTPAVQNSPQPISPLHLPETDKQKKVREEVTKFEKLTPDQIKEIYGNVQEAQPAIQRILQGNTAYASNYYDKGFGQEFYATKAFNLILSAATSLLSLPARIFFLVKHLFSNSPNRKLLLEDDCEAFKSIFKCVVVGTVLGAAKAAFALIADPLQLLLRAYLGWKDPNGKSELILVDPQLGFAGSKQDIQVNGQTYQWRGGALPVKGAWDIVKPINAMLENMNPQECEAAVSEDTHPLEHGATHIMLGVPKDKANVEQRPLNGIPGQPAWNVHCVKDSQECTLLPGLRTDLITGPHVQKGRFRYADSNGAFEDNNGGNRTDLATDLRNKNVKNVYVGGLATDYCVLQTALQAVKEGFKVFFVNDISRGIGLPAGTNQTTVDVALQKMRDAGIQIVNSTDLIGKVPAFTKPAQQPQQTSAPAHP